MARRPRSDEPERLRRRLADLINGFEQRLLEADLREQVRALVPVFHALRDLGSSLIPRAEASSARSRILHYLLRHRGVPIAGDELMVVSGIQDYPRRIRELRVEYGWSILSGPTARAMAEAGDLDLPGAKEMKPHGYVLTSAEQDREAAYRWRVANDLRRNRTLSTQEKLLTYLRHNVGHPVSGEEMDYVANGKREWTRRVRELRTEEGWPVKTKSTEGPDLPVGTYLLEEDRQAEPHDRQIKDSERVKVLERDAFRCRCCGWSYDDRRPNDRRSLLELHHVNPHVQGGTNTAENLVTLCNVHHDEVHRLRLDDERALLAWLDECSHAR